MKTQERYRIFIDYFSRNQPEVTTELNYKTPYQLIVAVILSAQCTDKRVNIITPEFFNHFPDIQTLAGAETEEIYSYIKSCSYPNNKAKHLSGMAKTLVNEFKGIIPSDTKTLQKLPGVGRKTANVIASVLFDIPAMAVDTHVFRVSARIGLTKNARTPLEAEKQLTANIPEDKINLAHHWLILHGRYICKSRKPDCINCNLKEICIYYSRS